MNNSISTSNPSTRFSIAALAAALAIGVAAGVLKWLIKTISHVATSHFDIGGGNWWLILVPVVGILITGWIVRKLVKMPLDNATSRLKTNLEADKSFMPARLTVSSVFTSAITLGFGGSAGAEGPIAYTGAAIGSNVGRFLGLDKRSMLILMACGAGAGIAAIFKAPIGGMFFTLEVLRMELGLAPVLMLASMCLISTLTAYVLNGYSLDIAIQAPIWSDVSMLPSFILLGLFAGVYSAYYLRTGDALRQRIQKLQSPVSRNIVSGLTLGLMLFLFPSLYGEGYGVLTHVVNGDMSSATAGSICMLFHNHWQLPLALAGILLAKSIATYATNSGGGVAGDFAPTLFAGGICGAFFALVLTWVPWLTPLPVDVAVVCGMAAVMSGVIRAPLMTIFLVVEMTASVRLLLPVSVAVMISLFVSRWLMPKA